MSALYNKKYFEKQVEAAVNPNVAEIFGPKALRSLHIRPSRNG
jgi:hypothetical protein